jgi:hypothetical protein
MAGSRGRRRLRAELLPHLETNEKQDIEFDAKLSCACGSCARRVRQLMDAGGNNYGHGATLSI